MSTEVNNPLYKNLLSDVNNASILVVGAGGVGCELLKNLVLTGFRNIEVIDLDTIDVSNLNRQFLFQKKHVGKAKATVAKESVLKLCPSANIVARHDSIFNPHYNMQYFKQFDLVMNALDNRAARNHVNRMCLAADIPLIESGSAGYLGQVTVIKKGLTECYECQPAPRQKTFPGCTIRNTPSELIHCIVWAKYLFNQLFGEEDADQDVSPDTADPEAAQDKEESGTSSGDNGTTPSLADIQRRSTREWARECDYDAEKIFNKLFHSDINYLLSMDKLWQKRTPPEPVLWSDCQDVQSRSLDQQTVLTLQENTKVFAESITSLKEQFKEQGEGGMLVWDKDDSAAMNFTASVANIRAHIFHIQNKSHFEVKSMAGNIIPAIATTNAVVAGLIVMQALFLIRKQMSGCRSVYVWKAANHAKKLLIPCSLDPPKHGCYVCAEKPEITLQLDTTKLTCEQLRDKILKSHLGMLAPDVEILDGRGTILISSDEDEENVNMDKTLDYFNITHGTRLRADDFLQNYDIVLNILQEENLPADQLFKVAETKGVIGASVEEKSSEKPEDVKKPDSNTNNNVEVIEDIDELNVDSEESRKRKLSSPSHSNSQNSSKRLKQSENNVINVDNDDTIILD